MGENPACLLTVGHSSKPRRLTVDMVPEVALIEVFYFYLAKALDYDREAWIILAHVCRKWRDIVFGSPRRLNVRLHFRGRRSVRAMLDTWPPLLIDIQVCDFEGRDVGNIVAALEHNDRIHEVELWESWEPSLPQMEQVLAAMQKPFPSLTELAVKLYTETGSLSLPDLFLSGSAPLLRSLWLRNVQFPVSVLRNLVRSADLVRIRIWQIPDAGFVSPEDVVACLSGLTRLEEFELGFQYALKAALHWASRHLPSSARCVLPALTTLRFTGPSVYLEHLIAPIDGPLLDNLDVVHHRCALLNTPQLAQFVDRTPKLNSPREAHIFFGGSDIIVSLPWTGRRGLNFRIAHIISGQLPVMVQLCTSSFLRTLIPMIKRLYILQSDTLSLYWLSDVESSQWLDLLRPFTAVEDLYLSQKFLPHIVPALHGISGEGMTEVLPSLQNLFLERPSRPSLPGPVEEATEQSVTALNFAGRPIAVSQWDRVCDPWWRYEDR